MAVQHANRLTFLYPPPKQNKIGEDIEMADNINTGDGWRAIVGTGWWWRKWTSKGQKSESTETEGERERDMSDMRDYLALDQISVKR